MASISRDRLTSGFIAGLAGGVAMNIINLISYYANWGQLRFLDWAAIVIYGTRPINTWEAVFAQMAQLIFVGILGILFAYLIPTVSSRNYLLKGWLFGSAVWFALYGISLLFKLEQTIPLRLNTASSDLICASVYGLIMVETLHRLRIKRSVSSN